MENPILTTNVRQVNGLAVIDMHGDINAQAETALNAGYAAATADRPNGVLLNFGGVQYINSTGIALIVGLLAQARKAHLPLSVTGLSDHYQEIFRITRLADFMSVYADESAALAGVGR